MPSVWPALILSNKHITGALCPIGRSYYRLPANVEPGSKIVGDLSAPNIALTAIIDPNFPNKWKAARSHFGYGLADFLISHSIIDEILTSHHIYVVD